MGALEQREITAEERGIKLAIFREQAEEPACDQDAAVMPAHFLKLGEVPLNALTEIADVRQFRRLQRCCVMDR